MKPSGRKTFGLIIAVLVVIVLLGGGWLFLQWRETSPPLASFTEHDVAVKIYLEEDSAHQPWLVGVFTPTRKDFHLYSKNLPRGGLDGLGRPTLLEIISVDKVEAIGPLVADRVEDDFYSEAIKRALPVYPDGPVTLRLPIKVLGQGASTPAELSVTYMACSAETCLPPVIDKRIEVVIGAKR